MANFHDPWINAYRPALGELVRYMGYGRPLLARVVGVDWQRERVLLALDVGLRRWDYVSNVRRYVRPAVRVRVKANPAKRGRKAKSLRGELEKAA